MRLISLPIIALNIGLILSNVVLLYLFAIRLDWIVVSIAYFVSAVGLPGYIITHVFLNKFCNDKRSGEISRIPLVLLFGLCNVLIAYLIGQISHLHALHFFFVLPYALLFFRRVRDSLFQIKDPAGRIAHFFSKGFLSVILGTVFVLNFLMFSMRPTPGILPLDLFHDHVWNAGTTVSLVSNFPLRSLNIETMPRMGYHILVHVLGAHMALVTGITPHLAGLQIVFIPLIPVLVMNMAGLLRLFSRNKTGYLLYGMCVVLFGQGLSIVHEVKVDSIINSNTNFMGVILLFCFMTTLLESKTLTRPGRWIVIFLGVFLSAAAKISLGASLLFGIILWKAWEIRSNGNARNQAGEILFAIAGFCFSYGIFFVLPKIGQPVYETIHKNSFAILPFAYITKNAMCRPFLDVLYKYFPEVTRIPLHAVFTVFVLPIYILFYFSYRLIVLFDLKFEKIQMEMQPIYFIALGSLSIGYIINLNPQDNAYFLNTGLLMLDVAFFAFLLRQNVFDRIRGFWREKQIFAFVGAVFILILPFMTINNWVRPQYRYNLFMYGKIGQYMDEQFKHSEYRKAHQTVTPDMYDVFQYIRKNTGADAIVITPFIGGKSKRHISFFTSAFTERTAFIEGYDFGNVLKKAGTKEIENRMNVVDKIYDDYEIPDMVKNSRYLIIADTKTKLELEKRNRIFSIYGNAGWHVLKWS